MLRTTSGEGAEPLGAAGLERCPAKVFRMRRFQRLVYGLFGQQPGWVVLDLSLRYSLEAVNEMSFDGATILFIYCRRLDIKQASKAWLHKHRATGVRMPTHSDEISPAHS